MNCKVCGKKIEQYFGKDLNQKLIDEQLCFHCDFFNTLTHEPETVIINGEAFSVGDEKGGVCGRGYGGRKFEIQMNDGWLVVTTNLWHRGTVPEQWRKLLPDNAIFKKDGRD